MKKKAFAFLSLALVISLVSLNAVNAAVKPAKKATTAKVSKKQQGVLVGGALMVQSKNIVENAVNSKDHTTLVTAVKEAGLVETLSQPGPYTVFAPTNEAFAKLPAGTVDELLKPENKDKLTSILTYHVVPGKITAKDLKDGEKLKTVNGQELTVSKKGANITINGAKVQIPDVISSNGVTYVIDSVVLPSAPAAPKE
jgi:uncharacterized surface protein with fasciclin (FAS1) repeats